MVKYTFSANLFSHICQHWQQNEACIYSYRVTTAMGDWVGLYSIQELLTKFQMQNLHCVWFLSQQSMFVLQYLMTFLLQWWKASGASCGERAVLAFTVS